MHLYHQRTLAELVELIHHLKLVEEEEVAQGDHH
jgi:hypothetical protein